MVICVFNGMWCNYKVEVCFELCYRFICFFSIIIVYFKYFKVVYIIILDYNCCKMLRRFLFSVEFEVVEFLGSDDFFDEC